MHSILWRGCLCSRCRKLSLSADHPGRCLDSLATRLLEKSGKSFLTHRSKQKCVIFEAPFSPFWVSKRRTKQEQPRRRFRALSQENKTSHPHPPFEVESLGRAVSASVWPRPRADFHAPSAFGLRPSTLSNWWLAMASLPRNGIFPITFGLV